MDETPRYVFDTGVLVSAAMFRDSTPGKAIREALSRGSILMSSATAHELQDVFIRPKFDRYLRSATRKRFLAALLRRATIVEIEERFQACRDPKDNKFLDLAVASQASCLVTGDEDLLTRHPFQRIPIVTPADFLSTFCR
jgi:uncharacterized protein